MFRNADVFCNVAFSENEYLNFGFVDANEKLHIQTMSKLDFGEMPRFLSWDQNSRTLCVLSVSIQSKNSASTMDDFGAPSSGEERSIVHLYDDKTFESNGYIFYDCLLLNRIG